jgi:hypothetical protein
MDARVQTALPTVRITKRTQNGVLVELYLDEATERHVAVWKHDQD